MTLFFWLVVWFESCVSCVDDPIDWRAPVLSIFLPTCLPVLCAVKTTAVSSIWFVFVVPDRVVAIFGGSTAEADARCVEAI